MYEIIYELYVNESLRNVYISICEIFDYIKSKCIFRDFVLFLIMYFEKKIK